MEICVHPADLGSGRRAGRGAEEAFGVCRSLNLIRHASCPWNGAGGSTSQATTGRACCALYIRNGTSTTNLKIKKSDENGAKRVPKGSQRSEKVAKWSQKAAKRSQKGPKWSQRVPKGSQRASKRSQRPPKASQRTPKGSQRAPKVSQRAPKGSQKVTKVHPKVALGAKVDFWSHFGSHFGANSGKNLEKTPSENHLKFGTEKGDILREKRCRKQRQNL